MQASETFRRQVMADLAEHVSSRSRVMPGPGTELGMWSATSEEPLVRIEAGSETDVVETLRICRSHGLRVAVWGGRHDIFARNDGAAQAVLDLRRLRAASYSPQLSTVTVEGGTTVQDVLDVLPSDRVAVTTANLGVGLIGAASGGGYGPLVGRFGMMCDQLVAARVVLADGSVIDADTDLLWGLRGGGSGFGVVTRADFTAHPLENVLFVTVAVPMGAAVQALLLVQEVIDAEPDRIGILPLFANGEDGSAFLLLMMHWSGNQEAGRRWVARITGLAGAATVTDQWAPYVKSFNPGEDAIWPRNMRWSSRATNIARIDQAVAEQLVEAVHTMPSTRSVLFLHDFHGVPARKNPENTAFAPRTPHFVVVATSPSAPGDAPAQKLQMMWADRVRESLGQAGLPGGYINFLAPDETSRLAETYSDGAATRLRALKTKLDPNGLFIGRTGL